MGSSHSQTLSGLQENSQEKDEAQTVLGILPSLFAHVSKMKNAHIVNSMIDELNKCDKKLSNNIPVSICFARSNK